MLYIHIPFCKQACHYCDFHFSTNLAQKVKMIDAICEEIELRKSYLSDNTLKTIYFGGGTPSLLSEKELDKLFTCIHKYFKVVANAEITLEANPDDLSDKNFKIFKSLGINRLSIGIQSFNENHLKFMNRAHNSKEALDCVNLAKDAGFDNISIDLIYGIPFENHTALENDIILAKQLEVSHISAYCLTIEPKTTFGKWVKTNKIKPIDESFAAEQFNILMDGLNNGGYEQYEISNFARNGNYSKHNSSYWSGKPYLGLGPSAHSFDGESRQNNISNNNLYIKGIDDRDLNISKEILSIFDKTNEYLMTSLRTIWGCNLKKIEEISGNLFFDQNASALKKYLDKNWITKNGETINLTQNGKYFADLIASDLFIE